MRLDQILSLSNIYINSNLNPLTKFTSSSRSMKLKDILAWFITETVSISRRIVINNAMKWASIVNMMEHQ